MPQDKQRYPATNQYKELQKVFDLTNELSSHNVVPANKDELNRMLKALEFLHHFENARSEFLEAALHFTGWGWHSMTTIQRKQFVRYFLSGFPLNDEPAEVRYRREREEERKDRARIIRENKAWDRAHPRKKA